MQNVSNFYVGVDVSKKNLDIHLHPINKAFRVKNDEIGIAKFIKSLDKYPIGQVVFEASGGCERLLLRMLQKNNIYAWRVEPRRIKGFIRSEGVYAKTDATDAKMIALFAAEKTCKANPIALTDEIFDLKAFVARRHDLSMIISGEKTRLQQTYNSACNKLIEQTIEFLTRQQKEVDIQIQSLIKANSEWKQKSKIAQSMKGIGPVSAAILIAEMPELGSVKSKPIAALAGVAPFVKQSGNYNGNAQISGGRSHVRRVLYMAALSAAHSNSLFKEFYLKLRNKGKKAKVAIVAVVRKMLVILNAMFKNNTLWETV